MDEVTVVSSAESAWSMHKLSMERANVVSNRCIAKPARDTHFPGFTLLTGS